MVLRVMVTLAAGDICSRPSPGAGKIKAAPNRPNKLRIVDLSSFVSLKSSLIRLRHHGPKLISDRDRVQTIIQLQLVKSRALRKPSSTTRLEALVLPVSCTAVTLELIIHTSVHVAHCLYGQTHNVG